MNTAIKNFLLPVNNFMPELYLSQSVSTYGTWWTICKRQTDRERAREIDR